jgi:hypothetical protein
MTHSRIGFPLHPQHNHAPGLVECPNGTGWCRGIAVPANAKRTTGWLQRAAARRGKERTLQMADTPASRR